MRGLHRVPIVIVALSLAAAACLAQDLWTLKAPMPTARIAGSAVAVDGRLYVLGGQQAEEPVNEKLATVEIYDPVTDTWASGAAMPTPCSYIAAAAIDGLIYAMGGAVSATSATQIVQVYDPRTDSWSAAPAMPRRTSGAEAAVLGGRIYVIGGGAARFVDVFDPATSAWAAAAPHPQYAGEMGAGELDGRIYTTGTANDGVGVYTYEPAADSWTRKADLPEANWSMAPRGVNGRLYAVGKYRVYVYDPASDTWDLGANLPQPAAYPAAAAIDGRLYVVGGIDDAGQPLATLQVLELGRPDLVAEGPTDLSVRVGQTVRLPVELALNGPQPDGSFPELQVDASRLDGQSTVALAHLGGGRYSAWVTVTPPRSGEYCLPVHMVVPEALPRYLTGAKVTVWPEQQVDILAEGLAPGWQATASNRVARLELAQPGTACSGQTACALEVSSTMLWTLTLKPDSPVAPFGYRLHLAFNAGTVAPGGTAILTIGVPPAAVAVDLLGAGRIDLARQGWQEVDLPLEEFGLLGRPFEGLLLRGRLTGVFYLDDVRLEALGSPTAVVQEYSDGLPQACALVQNFPNPFNSSTVIGFALPEAAEVNLEVYNLAGQRVATLAQGHRAAGSYRLTWDGTDGQGHALASGVYLYQLRAGDRQEQVRKLLLVR